jgi:hypothetical protein
MSEPDSACLDRQSLLYRGLLNRWRLAAVVGGSSAAERTQWIRRNVIGIEPMDEPSRKVLARTHLDAAEAWLWRLIEMKLRPAFGEHEQAPHPG